MMNFATALEKQIQVHGDLYSIWSRVGHALEELDRLSLRSSCQLLERATPVFWSRKCMNSVKTASNVFDLDEIETIRELIPWDIGFWWFEEPLLNISWIDENGNEIRPHIMPGSKLSPINAILVAWVQYSMDERPSLSVTAFTSSHGIYAPSLWITVTAGKTLSFCEEGSARPETWT